jgi:hypothetical protein
MSMTAIDEQRRPFEFAGDFNVDQRMVDMSRAVDLSATQLCRRFSAP